MYICTRKVLYVHTLAHSHPQLPTFLCRDNINMSNRRSSTITKWHTPAHNTCGANHRCMATCVTALRSRQACSNRDKHLHRNVFYKIMEEQDRRTCRDTDHTLRWLPAVCTLSIFSCQRRALSFPAPELSHPSVGSSSHGLGGSQASASPSSDTAWGSMLHSLRQSEVRWECRDTAVSQRLHSGWLPGKREGKDSMDGEEVSLSLSLALSIE